jgi:hypothetical protein
MDVPEVSADLGEVVHRQKAVGVIFTEPSTKAICSLFVEFAGAVEVTKGSSGQGEAIHGGKGGRVVVAQGLTETSQGVLVQFTSGPTS